MKQYCNCAPSKGKLLSCSCEITSITTEKVLKNKNHNTSFQKCDDEMSESWEEDIDSIIERMFGTANEEFNIDFVEDEDIEFNEDFMSFEEEEMVESWEDENDSVIVKPYFNYSTTYSNSDILIIYNLTTTK